MSAETPSRPLSARGLTRLRTQLRGPGPLGPAADGAATPERREGRARDGRASGLFGGGRPTRGVGGGTTLELVAVRRQMDLDLCLGTAFVPSRG